MTRPATATERLNSIVQRLADPQANRSEATIQSDVRMLLLEPELALDEEDLDVPLETPVGGGKRIDVEIGCTVIEVKKTLGTETAITSARAQLAGYVKARADEMGQRYVGILTDGRLWIAYHEVDEDLKEATRFELKTKNGHELLQWLEGVLATKVAIKPTPTEISNRLGAKSSSHALDFSTLQEIYTNSKDHPTVVLKRELWANLLRSALGTQFTDTDELFLEHTLLVNSAEIIAHLVLGVDVKTLSAATILSGDQFARAGLYGVVDRDFFDWVIEVEGGEGYIASLARRLARFTWTAVEHDVLKVLYESVISAETRRALGEYYTPDWLAKRVVDEVVTDPLHQRVLDPSCGSGTFLFYAVRRFLEAAEAEGTPLSDAMGTISSRVMGIDLHPVAVSLARVTYLLALGRDALNAEGRGTLHVPVFLGDSLGWDQQEDILSVDQLVIPTEVGDQLFSGELRFPDHLLSDGARFDQIVEALVTESERAANGNRAKGLSEGTIRRLAIDSDDVALLNANFARLKQLHEADRNHIWSYYIRNVARPAWLSRQENRVDVLVGNPPWLSYRNMTNSMQKRFKVLSEERGFWHNETTATHQDLAGVFVARAVEKYLKTGGRLGFVVPNSVVDRDYWSGFRRGRFSGANVQFGPSWDLRRVRPHLFPRGSAVIYGARAADPLHMPTDALIWEGRAPSRGHEITEGLDLRTREGHVVVTSEEDDRSPYSDKFAQGASLVPRYIFRVKRVTTSSLGVPSGRVEIESERSVSEKKPWKERPNLRGNVESQFLWTTVLGESILPYRLLDLPEFVVPALKHGRVLGPDDEKIDAFPGLSEWIRKGNAEWTEFGRGNMTLVEQIDHMRKLSQQIPPPPLRVVYAASGMHIAAARVEDERVLVDTKAYWCAVNSSAEADFLIGILNAPAVTTLVRPLMSYGKDERDIHKHVWRLPIPTFQQSEPLHNEIATLSHEVGEWVAQLDLKPAGFVQQRRQLRTLLASNDRAMRLDELVTKLLDELP